MSVDKAKGFQTKGSSSNKPDLVGKDKYLEKIPLSRLDLTNKQASSSDLSTSESTSTVTLTTFSEDLALALGLPWTKHNPVWGLTALDRLRSLQSVLIKKAIVLLSEPDRVSVLAATKIVESSVQLRLRFDQAQLTEQTKFKANLLRPNSEKLP